MAKTLLNAAAAIPVAGGAVVLQFFGVSRWRRYGPRLAPSGCRPAAIAGS